MSTHEDQYEVVKWYTRARRFPQLIGKTPDGARLWGGPYTYTQVIGAVAVLVVGIKTVGLWGQFGLIGNALVLLAVAYATTLGLGRLPIGSRNPLSVAQGALKSVSTPRVGSYAGRALKIRPPHRVCSKVAVTPVDHTYLDVERTVQPKAPRLAAAAPAASRGRPRWSRPAPAQRPEPSRPRPARASAPSSLSNVQRLLASTGSAQQEN
jgi:hypothetical protein